MSVASPETRGLARLLIALEAARSQPGTDQIDNAVKVCENLGGLISKLVGNAGFGSLLSRALALAKAEAPLLNEVKVKGDGSLEGFETVGREFDTGEAGNEGVALVSQLLELLVTFIGQALTLSLVRDAWPDVTLNGLDLGTGEMP